MKPHGTHLRQLHSPKPQHLIWDRIAFVRLTPLLELSQYSEERQNTLQCYRFVTFQTHQSQITTVKLASSKLQPLEVSFCISTHLGCETMTHFSTDTLSTRAVALTALKNWIRWQFYWVPFACFLRLLAAANCMVKKATWILIFFLHNFSYGHVCG